MIRVQKLPLTRTIQQQSRAFFLILDLITALSEDPKSPTCWVYRLSTCRYRGWTSARTSTICLKNRWSDFKFFEHWAWLHWLLNIIVYIGIDCCIAYFQQSVFNKNYCVLYKMLINFSALNFLLKKFLTLKFVTSIIISIIMKIASSTKTRAK